MKRAEKKANNTNIITVGVKLRQVGTRAMMAIAWTMGIITKSINKMFIEVR